MSSARGWPFFIGAGRRYEYRTLIAPRFLVEAAEYGILDRHAGRTADGEIRVARVRSGNSPLWMAYSTRTVTEADVPGARDEHGRPLQVLAGFVCDTPIEQPDPADLAVAHDTGMAVYRRYLADEDRFGVLGSEPYPLRSVLRPAVTTSPRPAATPSGPPQAPPGALGRRSVQILSLAALVLAAVVAVLVVTLSGGDDQNADPTCAASEPAVAIATATVDATPEPTPTCR
jgi:hypothetical protein